MPTNSRIGGREHVENLQDKGVKALLSQPAGRAIVIDVNPETESKERSRWQEAAKRVDRSARTVVKEGKLYVTLVDRISRPRKAK